MDTAIIWHEAYAEHETGAHPEGTDRIDTVVGYLERRPIWPRLTVVKPPPATDADVLLVHTPEHLAMIHEAAAGGGRWIDPDTHVSARSYEVALLSVGGAIEATRLWERGLAPFALIRPPGHHATPDHAMGFCLFNNVAVAAARLLTEGCRRVAIVDWDVHHGNGTQAAFYEQSDVLFVSAHQWPHYPGSGFYNECGKGPGEGFTVNLPLPPGSADADYVEAFDEVIGPILRQYRPEALLVSAGQDIHVDDPLGSMLVTTAGFAQMGLRCLELARELCDGRLAFVLEGGYDRAATAASVEAVLAALLDEQAPPIAEGSGRARPVIDKTIETQRRYWEL